MTRALLLAAAAAAAIGSPARAAGSLEGSGYLKNLYRCSRSPLTQVPYWGDLTRARVTLEGKLPLSKVPDEWSPAAWELTAHADYDHELRLGTQLMSLENRMFGLAEPSSHLTMEQTISSGTDGHYRHRLYRGWVELKADAWRLRFGRQRVAWGSGKMWNPTDILNPFEPMSLERDERAGVDALHLRRGIGALGQGELVYTLADRWAETHLMARVRQNVRRADLALMGGKVDPSSGSWTAGGELSADVRGGNLHAEWTYTDLRSRSPFWRAMIGYDYTFSTDPPVSWLKDAWVLAEYYHNGGGDTDPASYDRTVVTHRYVPFTGWRYFVRPSERGERFNARDYAGWALRKEPHPLVEFEVYAILNINDRSHFVNPSVQWNAADNLYLEAGWQRFGGTPASEFGPAPNITYLQAQYFFTLASK